MFVSKPDRSSVVSTASIKTQPAEIEMINVVSEAHFGAVVPINPPALQEVSKALPELRAEVALAGATFEGVVRNPEGATSIVTAANPTFDPDRSDVYLVPAAERDPFNPDEFSKYLSGNKAALVLAGGDTARSVDLKKKVDGKKITDKKREDKLTLQFAKLKYTLGLDKTKNVSYSVNWHILEVTSPGAAAPMTYDLTKKEDIKTLLTEQGLDPDDHMVDQAFKDLLAINKEAKNLTHKDVGLPREPLFLKDYAMGNPSGLSFFHTFSDADKKLKEDAHKRDYDALMQDFGLRGENTGIFSYFTSGELTTRGENAERDMTKASNLRNIILSNIEAKIKELAGASPIDKQSIAELKQLGSEIGGADTTVIDFTLMEFAREHSYNGASVGALALLNSEDSRYYLAQEAMLDYDGFVSKKYHSSTIGDKLKASQVGALIYHLTPDSNRIDLIQATEKLQRNTYKDQGSGKHYAVGHGVFKEPKGEKLILSTVLHLIDPARAVEDKDLKGYENASDSVKNVLKQSLQAFTKQS